MCFHSNQHICFNPTYHPQEQWKEIRNIQNPGNLVRLTQEFSPDKPMSMLFNACIAIDKGGYVRIGCGYGGLTWERVYTSDDKYMCRRDNSRSCDDVGSYYCSYWNCISWATWQRALLHRGKAAPDCIHGTCNPVNFTVLKPSDWTQGHVIDIRID
jgi:hypothetical protein